MGGKRNLINGLFEYCKKPEASEKVFEREMKIHRTIVGAGSEMFKIIKKSMLVPTRTRLSLSSHISMFSEDGVLARWGKVKLRLSELRKVQPPKMNVKYKKSGKKLLKK